MLLEVNVECYRQIMPTFLSHSSWPPETLSIPEAQVNQVGDISSFHKYLHSQSPIYGSSALGHSTGASRSRLTFSRNPLSLSSSPLMVVVSLELYDCSLPSSATRNILSIFMRLTWVTSYC